MCIKRGQCLNESIAFGFKKQKQKESVLNCRKVSTNLSVCKPVHSQSSGLAKSLSTFFTFEGFFFQMNVPKITEVSFKFRIS